jgi:transcriptional regulator with XRE-family HTH domain
MQVGINVRRLREARHLSQEELAFEAELHRTYTSGVERGIRNPTVSVVAKIARALGVTPDQLLRTGR